MSRVSDRVIHLEEEDRIARVFEARRLEDEIDDTDYFYLALYEREVRAGKKPDWLPRILYIEEKTGRKIPRRRWLLPTPS